MSSNSSSSTPTSLTPDSTGSMEIASPEHKWQKPRPQVAFYPNLNSTNKPLKPFSRSAAKRESVMTLGSIEHLQHYFTKTGLVADKTSLNMATKGLVPALGELTEVQTGVARLPRFELPPSPAIPQVAKPAFPPVVKTYETDPHHLRPGVVDDLEGVASIWGLSDEGSHQSPELPGASPKGKGKASDDFDVLKALKASTRAIRSVRNYVLSLPSESYGTSRSQYRPHTLSSSPLPKRHTSNLSTTSMFSIKIRKSALNVLAVLRELEETSRLPLSDEAYDTQSDHGGSQVSHSRVASLSSVSDGPVCDHGRAGDSEHVSITLMRVQGRDESVPVWEDPEDDFNLAVEEQKREGWEERLVLGSGWLYKQGIQLEMLEKERQEIKSYLDVVDEVLFGGPKDGKRGWHKERNGRSKGRRVSGGDADKRDLAFPEPARIGRRVASTGTLETAITEEPEEMMDITEEDTVDDDDLPGWAKRTTFEGDPLGRAHAILVALLPVNLLPILPMECSDRRSLLYALSAGQALCVAYNTGVRQSRKPWGYISKDAIHDIMALEAAAATEIDEKSKLGGWTFRRSDNLRLWISALKLRYLLPITGPIADNKVVHATKHLSPPLSSPVRTRFNADADEIPIYFDAPLVARQGEGWESMLEAVLFRWVEAIVAEHRREG